MSNVLSVYDPLFYAQEALIQLEKSLGMAGRVHRGYDKSPQQKGSTISIPRPSTFSAQDAPSTAQDINASEVQIVLNQWREVKFKLTDKELTFTTEKIINDHIRPAAYALADDIDQKLALLYKNVPWFTDVGATAAVADITAVRKLMFDNAVPMRDPSMINWMLDSDMEADLLANSAFAQWQGSGEAGASTQRTGDLGMRYGFNFFANQNVQSHTKGTCSDSTLDVNGTVAAGGTSINLDSGAVTGTLVPGDTFVIAGNTQRYAITNTTTASGNAFTGVTFTPALVAEATDGAVVTISLDDHSATLAFHRNAFALAMAPLTDLGNQLGARIATISDPITNLALRSRLYYVGNSSEVHVALDVLYGVKTLDPNLAVRARN